MVWGWRNQATTRRGIIRLSIATVSILEGCGQNSAYRPIAATKSLPQICALVRLYVVGIGNLTKEVAPDDIYTGECA
jgi:hypothetical protein